MSGRNPPRPGHLPGTIPSPNVWDHPDLYEVENRAVDPDGQIEAALRSVLDWADRDLLDLGCGSGFHLSRWAETARSVVGVEPHPGLAAMARRRAARSPYAEKVRVLQGTAQDVPLRDASVDVVQARWAYFFGPGCEPGLRELDRVVRRGGAAYVIDNDATRSTFGSWFRLGYPKVDPVEVDRFWSLQGWERIPVLTEWRFESRADLESVVRIEFDRRTAERVLAGHSGVSVDYAVNVWWRRF